jgi:hypothetical protein
LKRSGPKQTAGVVQRTKNEAEAESNCRRSSWNY